MRIPLVDLAAQYRTLGEEIRATFERVASSGSFILGEELAAFEAEFAGYCGVSCCVGVGSGTDALHLALRASGVGAGDEVLTAANTYIATLYAISHAGAVPVVVDSEPDGFNIDVDLLESAITERTRAIVPVHLYGHPAGMERIVELARKYRLKIIEDACQAHGARRGGRRTGSFGDAGCFSFYPGKNLGAFGDGGAIVTDDHDLAERLRVLRHCGQSEKNVHPVLGYNSRLDALQAAILRVKLRHLDDWNESRRRAARRYDELLEGSDVLPPTEHVGCDAVHHLYVIRHPSGDALRMALEAQGISCGVHYPQLVNEQRPYRDIRTVPHGVPVASSRRGRIVSLPMFPEISAEQLRYVADAVGAFCERSDHAPCGKSASHDE